MTHIVVITTSFPHNNSGDEAAGTFVADFVEELASHVQVTVLAPGNETKLEDGKAYHIQRFAVPRLPLSLLSPANIFDWISIIRIILSGTRAINSILKRRPCNSILALWVLPSGLWAKYASKRFGMPYSTWALGSDIWVLGKIPLVRGLLKNILHTSQYCFADGYILKEDVERISQRNCIFMASSRRLTVSKNKNIAIEPPYKMAFLGRWHVNKGVDLLLEALGMLDENAWSKIEQIRICGGGPLEMDVSKAIDVLHFNGRPVYKSGFLDKSQATELLMWADYILIPSRIESIPVVFSDAMQCGVTVITTPVGDLPRIVKKYDVGILAANVSSDAIYNAICRALHKSPSEFYTKTQLASQEFNIKRIVKQYLEYINS